MKLRLKQVRDGFTGFFDGYGLDSGTWADQYRRHAVIGNEDRGNFVFQGDEEWFKTRTEINTINSRLVGHRSGRGRCEWIELLDSDDSTDPIRDALLLKCTECGLNFSVKFLEQEWSFLAHKWSPLGYELDITDYAGQEICPLCIESLMPNDFQIAADDRHDLCCDLCFPLFRAIRSYDWEKEWYQAFLAIYDRWSLEGDLCQEHCREWLVQEILSYILTDNKFAINFGKALVKISKAKIKMQQKKETDDTTDEAFHLCSRIVREISRYCGEA